MTKAEVMKKLHEAQLKAAREQGRHEGKFNELRSALAMLDDTTGTRREAAEKLRAYLVQALR